MAVTAPKRDINYAWHVIWDLHNHIAGLETCVSVASGERPYINVDNAATTPPFKEVLKSVSEFMPWYSSVHRGSGLKSRLSTEAYEQARHTVGQFVGADPGRYVVIFGKNTTEALNKLSYRLPLKKKDIVLVSHLEHHSNDLPWRARASVKRIAMNAHGGIDTVHFMSLLRRFAGRVKLVAITGGSNVTGYMPDIHWFARQAHAAGAQIVIDAAQLAAHRPISMGKLDQPEHLDYVVLSGHKMYAPFGTGALVARRDTFLRGQPEYRGGGTISLVTSKTVDWALPPDSDEAGSPNVAGAVALATAIRTLQAIGLDNITLHEATLTGYALNRLAAVPSLTIYGDRRPEKALERLGVIAFTLGSLPSHLVAAILGFEWGIGVRSGCFCAHPYVMSLLGMERTDTQRIRHHILHRRLDLVPGMVRISFGLYNSTADIDGVVEALRAITAGKYGQYVVDKTTGHYLPADKSTGSKK